MITPLIVCLIATSRFQVEPLPRNADPDGAYRQANSPPELKGSG